MLLAYEGSYQAQLVPRPREGVGRALGRELILEVRLACSQALDTWFPALPPFLSLPQPS